LCETVDASLPAGGRIPYERADCRVRKEKEKGFVVSLGGVTSSPVEREREQSRTGKCGKSFDAGAAIYHSSLE